MQHLPAVVDGVEKAGGQAVDVEHREDRKRAFLPEPRAHPDGDLLGVAEEIVMGKLDQFHSARGPAGRERAA